MSMSYDEFLQADNKLKSQIAELEEQRKQLEHEYFSRFPGVGDLVLYRGEKLFIEKVHGWGELPSYKLCRLKKDGTPSKAGRKEYLIRFDQIQPLEVSES